MLAKIKIRLEDLMKNIESIVDISALFSTTCEIVLVNYWIGLIKKDSLICVSIATT